MRQLIAMVFVSTLLLSTSPVPVVAAEVPTASITGIAQSVAGQIVANATVRLRNLETGALAGTTTRLVNGSFGFTGLAAGNYAIEVVSAAGQIIGTSTAIPVAAGATIANVAVTTSAAVPAAANAWPARSNKALLITTIAAVAGIAAVIAVVKDASPSK